MIGYHAIFNDNPFIPMHAVPAGCQGWRHGWHSDRGTSMTICSFDPPSWGSPWSAHVPSVAYQTLLPGQL